MICKLKITKGRYMETESRISVIPDLADFRSFKTALDSISWAWFDQARYWISSWDL